MALRFLSVLTPCSFAQLPPLPTGRRNANMPKQITCVQSTQKLQPTINRRSANYPKSFGDYDFIQSLRSDYMGEMYERRLEKLKQEVRCFLKNKDQTLVAQLKLTDTLQRLGLGHHFKKEIKEALGIIASMKMEYDLYATALQFRLLRQRGFEVSQDVFNVFMDKKGDFMESFCEDTEGMLSLYEASQLAFEGEIVLEKAKAFTIRHLRDLKGKSIDENLKRKVEHALELPFHWRMPRLEARWHIETYLGEENMNPLLSELAKLDYNMVQAIYQKDLKPMSRWWRSLGLGKNLSFARDRLMECFVCALGIMSEPEYSYCRKVLTKVAPLIAVLDDVYDIYGSLEELVLFTDVVDRWDINAMEGLPEYMKICFLAIFNTVNEVVYDTLKEEGWEITQYLKKLWADICKSFLVEAKWYNNGYTPTLDEYLNNAWISSTGPILLGHVYFLTRPKVTKEALEFVDNYPNLIRYPSMICRLCNDLASSRAELERGDAPGSIQCFMHETGALEVAAREHIKSLISDMWKKMNKELISSSSLPEPLINAAFDFARLTQCFYQHSDGFSDPNNETKERVMALLVVGL
ncbi:alpha-terpineol synthase, chloroplastic-like isoform X1 [Tasmannia lanceolata]|uniref:alpha-terpineol synthase, chloroplastic-like isoform X1 n=1 Tax=Tasmannia lanceolata TaxID=3420 RepID=UPI0040648FA0